MSSELVTTPEVCRKKNILLSKREAKTKARLVTQQYLNKGIIKKYRQYRCNVCNYWHLTTQPVDILERNEK